MNSIRLLEIKLLTHKGGNKQMKRIRSTKYDIRICKCGRIHTIPYEKIDKALDDNKNI